MLQDLIMFKSQGDAWKGLSFFFDFPKAVIFFEQMKSKILCFSNQSWFFFFFSKWKLFFDLLWNTHADHARKNFIYFPEFIINNLRRLYSISCLAWIPVYKFPFQEGYRKDVKVAQWGGCVSDRLELGRGGGAVTPKVRWGICSQPKEMPGA